MRHLDLLQVRVVTAPASMPERCRVARRSGSFTSISAPAICLGPGFCLGVLAVLLDTLGHAPMATA
jgi:hypothetical protein